jgi:hypothetical protein
MRRMVDGLGFKWSEPQPLTWVPHGTPVEQTGAGGRTLPARDQGYGASPQVKGCGSDRLTPSHAHTSRPVSTSVTIVRYRWPLR